MRDPLRPARGAANIGSAALGRSQEVPGDTPLYELGTVLAYNSATHTSVVRTDSGRPLKDVPQIKATAGGYDHIPTGTTVVIFWGLGFPSILGCIDLVGQAQSAIPAPTLTSVDGVGDSDPTQAIPGFNSYKPPGAPTDMSQGDWSQVGSFGNHVAVLEGGVSQIGSPAALLQSLGSTGTLRSIARRIQQFTDFGQLTVENLNGQTSLVLRAGANQTRETGLDEKHWTIRFDLGAAGDMLDFTISTPEGKLLFRLHAGTDGRVQIYGDGGVDLSSGANGTGTMNHDIVGDHITSVTGDTAHATQGNATTTVDGSASTSVAGNATHSINGHQTLFVGSDRDIGVSGDETHAVAGKRTTQVGDDDDTNVDGNSTVTAKKTNTLEGTQIKFGKNAIEPVIKGTTYGSSVMSQIAAAGSTLSAAGVTASVAMIPDAFAGTALSGTLAAAQGMAAALTAVGALLLAAASAYPSTLSHKVTTE